MNRWLKRLRDTLTKDQLVEIDRNPLDRVNIQGYVVGVSDQFVMLHEMSDYSHLNGYTVIRLDDLKRYRVIEDRDFFASRALKARKQRPKIQPKIDLIDLPTLLESANCFFPLITIHRERMKFDACYIGQVDRLTEKTLYLKEIDPAAKWHKTASRYRLKDITKIQFGQAYESALWLVSCLESGNKKLLAEARKLDKPYADRSR